MGVVLLKAGLVADSLAAFNKAIFLHDELKPRCGATVTSRFARHGFNQIIVSFSVSNLSALEVPPKSKALLPVYLLK
ncbi:MAG: hypothetical protein KME01_15285 [Chroococcus sp. CMT-3BRIN-NPC107]|nr:hypothetical protein [Chroococcus sp. CMT-3BRIN-NPC107]